MADDRFRTGDQALVRTINQTLILHHLRQTAPVSRAALSELTGLNKTTVSSIIRDLIGTSMIREIGAQSGGAGRPAIMLELNPDAGYIISAEIGVDFIALLRTNFTAEFQWQSRSPIREPHDSAAVLNQLVGMLKNAISNALIGNRRVFGVAVGVPGLVDQQSGQVLFAPNLGWHTIPLEGMLAHELDLPVSLDNEANMAALGELYFGVAQGYKNVLYLTLDVGLGGGIISNGQLFTGNAGFAGEFGHITMDPHGKLCGCGNRGCFETLVSLPALYDHVRTAVARGEPTLLADLVRTDMLNFEGVAEAARSGDQVGLAAFASIGRALGVGLASLVNIFDPQLIVLGGEMSRASELMLPIATEELTVRLKPWQHPLPTLAAARYTRDACVMGGIATVYDRIFNLHRRG